MDATQRRIEAARQANFRQTYRKDIAREVKKLGGDPYSVDWDIVRHLCKLGTPIDRTVVTIMAYLNWRK